MKAEFVTVDTVLVLFKKLKSDGKIPAKALADLRSLPHWKKMTD